MSSESASVVTPVSHEDVCVYVSYYIPVYRIIEYRVSMLEVHTNYVGIYRFINKIDCILYILYIHWYFISRRWKATNPVSDTSKIRWIHRLHWNFILFLRSRTPVRFIIDTWFNSFFYTNAYCFRSTRCGHSSTSIW